jgi:hypothetical protein
MSEEAKTKLMRDIDATTTRVNRDTQDARSDLDEAQGKVMQELGGKMMAVMEKYATQNALAVVLDVSNPQTPVLWAASAVDITNDIVKLYDDAYAPAGTSNAEGIADAIKRIEGGPHSALPSPQPGSGRGPITIQNDTSSVLTVYFSGSTSQKQTVPAHGRTTVTLTPGAYTVAGELSDKSVAPFLGSRNYTGGETEHFYVAPAQTPAARPAAPAQTPPTKKN